jgi:hypothetical protein
VVRASLEAEKLGFPTASIICTPFVKQGRAIAAALGMSTLPISEYPGQTNFHIAEEFEKNTRTILADQVIKNLTHQPEIAQSPKEPDEKEPDQRDIVFEGSFEEVNRFFYVREWSDGLPIVPPTIEKVEAFLKFVDRSPRERIGVLLPDRRECTVWNTAVNGVMAGCRPEYMPVLIAIVEAMADPEFGEEHLGHGPGTEVLITLNGPIIKDLEFNAAQGALRVGYQANTSIGRFWRLTLRNVAGFLPNRTDKGTFGGTWRVVLAENEDAVASMGWQPMSVDQGFHSGDNVVTINSCTSSDSYFQFGRATAEGILGRIAARVVDIQLFLFAVSVFGRGVRPQIVLSPGVAKIIAQGGYSKDKMRQFLYDHARFSARRFEHLSPDSYDAGSLWDAVNRSRLPKQYGESNDPERLLPIVWSPEDFLITVSGDPGVQNCFVCSQNGFIGYPVSKAIRLPAEWKKLMKEAKSW